LTVKERAPEEEVMESARDACAAASRKQRTGRRRSLMRIRVSGRLEVSGIGFY
jgi:hypothetical protein